MDVVQEKRARYREIREKALGITDRAIAENRQLTDEEQAQVEEAVRCARPSACPTCASMTYAMSSPRTRSSAVRACMPRRNSWGRLTLGWYSGATAMRCPPRSPQPPSGWRLGERRSTPAKD